MARTAKTLHFAMSNSYAQCISVPHVRACCRRDVRNVLQPIANTADIVQEMLTVPVCGSRQLCQILTPREKDGNVEREFDVTGKVRCCNADRSAVTLILISGTARLIIIRTLL